MPQGHAERSVKPGPGVLPVLGLGVRCPGFHGFTVYS